ncbi:hypothetical protein BJ944DRAFT_263199 [Cunninghamella echinulata]|nr:hypothetical protein BJ944DRAFT_263199 [Cunninghamella echinulata]
MISDVSPSTNVLWLALSGYIDLAKSIYVKERDTGEHNYRIPAKLGIWDDTPYPEFCKAVYTKDYVKVNSILEDGNEGWTITDCYSEDWAYSYEQGYATVQMEEDGTWDIEEDCYAWGWGCSSVSTTFDIQDILSGKVPRASLITSEEKETMEIIQHMVENKDKWYVERKYAYSTSINVIEGGKMRLSINGDDTSDLDSAIKHFLPMITSEMQKEGMTALLHLPDYM